MAYIRFLTSTAMTAAAAAADFTLCVEPGATMHGLRTLRERLRSLF